MENGKLKVCSIWVEVTNDKWHLTNKNKALFMKRVQSLETRLLTGGG